ncbi:hypothetical protein [Trebonia kvetii]|nr:hypothetical protein [Trebonia kvetii]
MPSKALAWLSGYLASAAGDGQGPLSIEQERARAEEHAAMMPPVPP